MERAVMLKNTALLSMSIIGGAIAKTFGGWDAALRVLIVLMVADYVTGVLLALLWQRSNKSESGALDSKAGFQGLCRKGMILLLVWIGAELDHVTGAGAFRTMIVLFFIGNEGISLLENLGLMGVPYPAFLQRALEAMKQKGDDGDGDQH